jgi:hypothetical protein
MQLMGISKLTRGALVFTSISNVFHGPGQHNSSPLDDESYSRARARPGPVTRPSRCCLSSSATVSTHRKHITTQFQRVLSLHNAQYDAQHPHTAQGLSVVLCQTTLMPNQPSRPKPP